MGRADAALMKILLHMRIETKFCTSMFNEANRREKGPLMATRLETIVNSKHKGVSLHDLHDSLKHNIT